MMIIKYIQQLYASWFRDVRLALIAAICLLCGLSSFAGIDVSFSHSTCRPGDVIELRAVSAFDQLTSFELKLPQHAALHLVAHQRQPIMYWQGEYTQEDVWVLQPMHSGVIHLEGLRALVSQGGVLTDQELPDVSLEVLPYEDIGGAQAPVLLSDNSVTHVSGRLSYTWVLLMASGGVIIALLYRFKKKPSPRVQGQESFSLAVLMSELERGSMPLDFIEQLLSDDQVVLSTALRVEMERAVYRLDSNAERLKMLLRTEVAQ